MGEEGIDERGVQEVGYDVSWPPPQVISVLNSHALPQL
jgi:hypothetical protein